MQPYRFPLKFGKYLLTRRIAVGGMAEVFKAKIVGIKGFEKTIAVKKILPEFNEDEDFVQMFVDEARISSYLNHNNIVHVFDFGVAEGSYYIAMEYVDGPNLKNFVQRLLKRKGQIPRNLALYIISQIARGLEYAHTVRIEGQENILNLVHRDISPQNILVSRGGEVKITDFGIAKAAIKLSRTQPGKIQGKFSYMSPEQAAGKPLDRRSDIFSLGIISYELLSGMKLYSSDDTHKRYAEVREARFPRIGELVTDLPAQVESLVMRMLERNPEDRPQNASEISSELGDILSSISTQELATQLGLTVDEVYPREASDSDAHHRIEDAEGKPFAIDGGEKKEGDTEPREITKSIEEEPTIKGGPLISLPLAALALLVSLSSVGAFVFYITRTKRPPQTVVVSPTPTPSDEEEAPVEAAPRSGPIDSDIRAAARAREAEVNSRMRDLEEQLMESEGKAEETERKLKQVEQKLKTAKLETHSSCPDDMVLLPQGNFIFGSDRSDPDRNDLVEAEARNSFLHKFCVDQFEYPNIRGKVPRTAATWNEAQTSCAKDGKRLCSQEEWERACKGPAQGKINPRYPYGSRYDPKACNTESRKDTEAQKLAPAGSYENCHTDEGIFDLSGNVDEWTGSAGQYSAESHVTRGGSKSRPGWASRCTSLREVSDFAKEADVGFRCCKDAL